MPPQWDPVLASEDTRFFRFGRCGISVKKTTIDRSHDVQKPPYRLPENVAQHFAHSPAMRYRGFVVRSIRPREKFGSRMITATPFCRDGYGYGVALLGKGARGCGGVFTFIAGRGVRG